MESIEIFEKISTRLVEATMMHSNFDDLLSYLGFNGFAEIHKYQFIDETHELRKVNNYAIKHLNYLIYNKDLSVKTYLPTEFSSFERTSVNRLDKRDIIRYVIETWVSCETQTKEQYGNFSKELNSNHDIASSLFVDNLIKDVDYELYRATDIMSLLSSCDYDLNTIVTLQNRYKAMYDGMIITKLKEMKGEYT